MVDFQGTMAARRAESQVGLIIVLSIIPTVISTTSVLLRIYTRRFILGGVASEDYAIVVAQLLGIGVAVNNVLMTSLGGLGRHLEFVQLTKGFFTAKALMAAMQFYNATQLVTKISFLLQYRRLFPLPNIQRICTGGLVFLAIWGIAQQIYTPFACEPLVLLQPQWFGKCINTSLVYNLNAVMNMVTDFLILIIPIWPVLQLHISRKRKIQLLVVFLLGFLACAISVVRLALLHRSDYDGYAVRDDTWNLSSTGYLSTIEISVGILCACIPTLRPLFRKYAPSTFNSSNHSNPIAKLKTIISTGSSSKNSKSDPEAGIYVQRDLEFQSTTELKSSTAATDRSKDPYILRGFSTDEISLQDVLHSVPSRDEPPPPPPKDEKPSL